MDEVIGNIGAPLDFVDYCVEDDEDGERDADAQIEMLNLEAGPIRVTDGSRSTPSDIEAAAASPYGNALCSDESVVDGYTVRFEGPEVRHAMLDYMKLQSDCRTEL